MVLACGVSTSGVERVGIVQMSDVEYTNARGEVTVKQSKMKRK
jgi:hypothetical protein